MRILLSSPSATAKWPVIVEVDPPPPPEPPCPPPEPEPPGPPGTVALPLFPAALPQEINRAEVAAVINSRRTVRSTALRALRRSFILAKAMMLRRERGWLQALYHQKSNK